MAVTVWACKMIHLIMLFCFFFYFSLMFFIAHIGSFEGKLVCHCTTEASERYVCFSSPTCRLFQAFKNIQSLFPSNSLNSKCLLCLSVLGHKRCGKRCIFSLSLSVCLSLFLEITELIRCSDQRIPLCLGYHQLSLSQQGLIHHSYDSNTHTTHSAISR